jgi:hypothetical protein
MSDGYCHGDTGPELVNANRCPEHGEYCHAGNAGTLGVCVFGDCVYVCDPVRAVSPGDR